MKKRFTDGQIVGISRDAGCRDKQVKDLRKRHNISEQTFYRWRNKFGGMDVADARRLTEKMSTPTGRHEALEILTRQELPQRHAVIWG
ncbi:hypothetical protein BDI4_580017 [Burkholderia diffusa]|nr:hypothetical protein BDI4_580017 [Burkholderia diffusa]